MDDTLEKITVTFAKWCYFKRQCYSSSECSEKISNIFTEEKKRLMYAHLNFIRGTRWHKMMLFFPFRVVDLLPGFKEINLDSTHAAGAESWFIKPSWPRKALGSLLAWVGCYILMILMKLGHLFTACAWNLFWTRILRQHGGALCCC